MNVSKIVTGSLFMFFFSTKTLADIAPDVDALLNHDMKRLHSSEVINLKQRYAGKPLVIINTASNCGFTGQFTGLEQLYQQYKDRGLMMAGFPSNTFFQEESEEKATADVCYINYGVTFDMYTTISVRGNNTHPIFSELARQSSGPKWNFYKYIINRDGTVVGVFPSTTSPDSPKFRQAIESVL